LAVSIGKEMNTKAACYGQGITKGSYKHRLVTGENYVLSVF
jgi:hypothetical protein